MADELVCVKMQTSWFVVNNWSYSLQGIYVSMPTITLCTSKSNLCKRKSHIMIPHMHTHTNMHTGIYLLHITIVHSSVFVLLTIPMRKQT